MVHPARDMTPANYHKGLWLLAFEIGTPSSNLPDAPDWRSPGTSRTGAAMNSWPDRTLLVILAFSPTASPADDKLADGDFTIGPAYTNAPELTVKDGVPRGVVTQFVMNSEDSK